MKPKKIGIKNKLVCLYVEKLIISNFILHKPKS